MKTLLLSLLLVISGLIAYAQPADTLVSFEAETDTTGWIIFATGPSATETDVTVVANPDTTGLNTSPMALRFVVQPDADPWAGMVLNDVFVGDSALNITESNYTFTLMVYRSTLGNVGLKLEREVFGGSDMEVVVPTTVINEWEVLTFEFPEAIGNMYEAVVIFPDFPEARVEGAEVYIDNLMFNMGPSTSAPLVEKSLLKVYPNPVLSRLHVQHPAMTGYTISNTLGQAVDRAVFGATHEKIIDVGHLKSGIHFLTIQAREGNVTTRFVKQ